MQIIKLIAHQQSSKKTVKYISHQKYIFKVQKAKQYRKKSLLVIDTNWPLLWLCLFSLRFSTQDEMKLYNCDY